MTASESWAKYTDQGMSPAYAYACGFADGKEDAEADDGSRVFLAAQENRPAILCERKRSPRIRPRTNGGLHGVARDQRNRMVPSAGGIP